MLWVQASTELVCWMRMVFVNLGTLLACQYTSALCLQAIDKLLSVMTLIVASIFGLQAVGLDGAPAALSKLELSRALLQPMHGR